MSVKRWDVENCHGWHEDEYGTMEEFPDGPYVAYEDYAQLEAERDRLQDALAVAIEAAARALESSSKRLRQTAASPDQKWNASVWVQVQANDEAVAALIALAEAEDATTCRPPTGPGTQESLQADTSQTPILGGDQ